MAKMHTLQDYFNGTALQTSLWTQFTASGGTCTYATTGASMNYPNPTNTSNDADIASNTTYDLTGSYGLVQVTNAPSGLNSDANFRMKIDTTNYVQWQQEGTTLLGAYVVGGVQTIKINLTYNATTHRWWRIREDAGTTYWDTSSDGLTWTNRASNANPITLTALTMQFAAVSFGADTALTPFTFNRFNAPLLGAKLRNAGLRPHPFSPGLAR